ncbi:MAG: hypothetical protein IKU36_02090 [Bacteroidales bacterium]|nr:hypothetical protein [Bacteroidales bacterium]
MKKTYTNVSALDVWAVIDDLQAIGLEITAMTATTITVAASAGMGINEIDLVMANRGFI